MLSDLASEVLKLTESQSPEFGLEKTVMERTCLLRVEWPSNGSPFIFTTTNQSSLPLYSKPHPSFASLFATLVYKVLS